MPPLVVKEGGFAFPLCPSGQHGLEVVDAFMEPWVYCLLKAINKANITKSRGGSMNLKLLDEFLHGAPWHRVASFLLAVAWQFGSVNISLSSIVNSTHVVSAGFAASKILLVFWVAQGPAEPPFMYKRTNKMLLHLSMNLVDLMLR